MNRGRSVESLVQEVERQQKLKVDYIAPQGKMEMRKSGTMDIIGQGNFHPNSLAHDQLAQKLGIPRDYYKRMLTERTALLAENVNTWLAQNPEEKRMARTLDGTLRCLVSDRYRPLDYYDMVGAALPTLHDLRMEMESCDVTDYSLRMKAVVPTMQTKVKGNIVAWGLHLWNSEVGTLSLGAGLFSKVLACSNGATHEHSFRRTHIGKRAEFEGEDAQKYYSSETKVADDRALWLKFRDTLRGILSRENIEEVTGKMNESTERAISDPTKAVQVVVKRFNLNDGDRIPLFRYLNESKDFTQWGLAQAMTRYAEDQKDYEQSTKLESYGGKIMELTDEGWQQLETEKVKDIKELALV